MKREEIPLVLDYLQARWPRRQISHAEQVVWTEALWRWEQEDALEALRLLTDTDEFLPSLARFGETVQGIVNRRAERRARERGLPEEADRRVATLGYARGYIDEARNALERARPAPPPPPPPAPPPITADDEDQDLDPGRPFTEDLEDAPAP